MIAEKTTPQQIAATYDGMTPDELYAVARSANVAVYERSIPVARRVARTYCKRYAWIDEDDLLQNLMFELPRILYSYRDDNSAGNPWSKFLYHKLYFKCKDILRKEDPLGLSWPQKREYPAWHRLGDASLAGFDAPDTRETLEVTDPELKDEIHQWRGYFESLPPMRKPKRDRLWDENLRRVKFKKHKPGLGHWLKNRRAPKQLSFPLDN